MGDYAPLGGEEAKCLGIGAKLEGLPPQNNIILWFKYKLKKVLNCT
jgi:hypothetical protein